MKQQLFLLLLFFPLLLPAQGRQAGQVSGRITDGITGQPVEYANVVLVDTLTRQMVTGMVTDSLGKFLLKNVATGTYRLEYSFIGYRKKRSDAFTLGGKHPQVSLGDLPIHPDATTMDEVTVTAQRSMLITKIDRKVFNVGSDITAQTGTVSEVLQNIPSVSVDIDGNISLRGSGNVTILINGRPSLIAGAANLEQMPASLVEKIEVITNPSARYRPDGTAGIINIILKKERKAGFNGILAANAGNNSRFNTNLQLNYNTGKVNLFGSYGYRQDYRYRISELRSQRIDTAAHTSTYLDQQSNGTAWPFSHLGQLGMDWFINDRNVAGISGNYNYRTYSRSDVSVYRYSDDSLLTTEEFTRSLDGRETEYGTGISAYYEHTFDRDKNHQVRIDGEFQQDTEKEDDQWTTVYDFPAYPQGKEHKNSVITNNEVNLLGTYIRPLWKESELEAGYEGIMDLDIQDQMVEIFDPESGTWIPNPENTNDFSARQTVHALFATIGYKWKSFSVLGGLRAEQTYMDLDFITIDTVVKSSYFAIYPTLHLGIASGMHEWQLNYSRRVNRPDGEDMNPVPEYRDPRNIFTGNPDLKPEDIHSVEFGYSWKNKSLTLVPTLFYRYKRNGFTFVTSSLNDTVLITTIDNLDSDQSAGLDMSGTWSVGKIININFSASAYYNQIDATELGMGAHKSAFSWNAKMNASVNATRTTIVQVNGQYRSKILTAQGYRLPGWVVNLGIRQDLWKKRLSLIGTVSDLFNTQQNRSEVETPVLVQESMRRRDGQVIFIGAIFNFGTNGKKNKDPKFEFDNRME